MAQINRLAKIIFYSFLIWLLLHLFFFQISRIPSASMKNTLIEGDYILVNKLAYGSRISITPLSFPFGNDKIFSDLVQLPYMRLPGYDSVCRNDMIVFNSPQQTELPVDERRLYVKRCVALPGDTLLIDSGRVYV